MKLYKIENSLKVNFNKTNLNNNNYNTNNKL